MKLLLLILSLPTENATVRMRAWRVLKASGAAVLRDGVYLMPELSSSREMLDTVAADVVSGGGLAYVMSTEEPDGAQFAKLFDRSEDYAALFAEIEKTCELLSAETIQDTRKQSRKLRKTYSNLIAIDFFPSEAQRQTDALLQALELEIARTLSSDEPQATSGVIQRLLIKDYQGRIWATRQRPWVDRLASAWLIKRFIDPQAQMRWLSSIHDCPSDALGFDFDGATFSHIDNRVTFEVLLESFGLDQAALKRIGALVHYLDVGGIQPPEATGIESVLAGLRESIANDDQLLSHASHLFDGLFTTFEKGIPAT